jgi:hypothetical protein
MKKILLLILSFLLSAVTYSQMVIDVTPILNNENMIVKYKITDAKSNQKFNISLYVSMDGGTSYIGPLKAVSGDVGEGITQGKHTINWDIFKDVNSLEGNIVFDVRAILIEPISNVKSPEVINKPVTKQAEQKKAEEQSTNKPLPDYTTKVKSYRKAKNTFFILTGVTAGVGVYYAFSANNLYENDYQNATNANDASDIHEQIETQDLIWKSALGVSAASLVTAIIFASKEKKAKRNIKADIIPLKDGAGISLTYRF